MTPEPADVTAGRIRQAQQPVPSPPLLLDPDAGSTPSAEDADDGVVVYLCPCDPEGFLLAVDAGGNVRASRRLPSLTRQAVRDKAFMHFDAYDRRHQDLGSWERALEATTAWLWGSYAEQLLDCVPTTDQVTIVAGGLLGLLPIHAAWTWDDTRPSGRRYLIDETAVSYAPSRSLLRPSGAGPGSGTLLAISDPRPSRQRPLPWAAWESSVISEYFDRTVARTGSAATVDTPEQLYGTVEIRVVTRELVPHLPCGGEAVGPYPVAVLSRLAKGEY